MRFIKFTPVFPLFIFIALALLSATARAETVSNVVYGHKDGMALVMDVYKPGSNASRNSRSAGAGVVYMISGGWMSSLQMQQAFESMFVPLVDAGYTVFAVRHGSSPRYFVPEAWSDVNLAFQYIGDHAQEYGVDPARLGVSGISAGGHLSLMLGLHADANTKHRPKAVVAYMPPVDIRSMVGPSDSFPALNFDAALAESVSPITLASADDPPILLIHGDADELVPISNSERMHAALKAAGVKTEFVVIPGAPHGLFTGEGGVTAARELLGWFEANL